MNDETPNGDPDVGDRGAGGELSTAEEAKLRSILTRAADGIVIETPAVADLESARMPPARPADATRPVDRPARRFRNGAWIGAVAALIVVIAIGGGVWRQSGGGDGGHLAATAESENSKTSAESPAADSGAMSESDAASAPSPRGEARTDGVAVDPRALVPGGIWRLPEGADSFEVTGVLTSKRTSGFQIAVDDVDEPSRWFAILPTKYWMNVGAQVQPAGTHELDNSMTATVIRPDPATSPTGSTWIDLEQRGDSLNALTFVYKGVGDDEALAIVSDIAASIRSLKDADAVRSALLGVRLPSGLVPTWDAERVGYPSDEEEAIESVDLTLRDKSSDEKVNVTLLYSGLSSAVARLEQLFGLEASQLNSAVGSDSIDVDTSPGVLALSYQGLDLLMAFTQDGVAMSAEPASHENLSINRQQMILDGLRPVSESEFRQRMREQGVTIE